MHILVWAAPLATITIFAVTYGSYVWWLHTKLKRKRDTTLRRARADALRHARRL